jgi:hypothetical protein
MATYNRDLEFYDIGAPIEQQGEINDLTQLQYGHKSGDDRVLQANHHVLCSTTIGTEQFLLTEHCPKCN